MNLREYLVIPFVGGLLTFLRGCLLTFLKGCLLNALEDGVYICY